jgi:hypothetical protein
MGLEALNDFVLVVLDSCRFDSWVAARPPHLGRLGEVERRWSYATWTSPAHYNLLIGLMPHRSPAQVYASDYYKRDFVRYRERLGSDGIEFKSLLPNLYLPTFLKKLGYRTHAMVSLPVLNPATILNCDFDSFELMPRHNDMAAMVERMRFSDDAPSFYLLNVGETHYPYALPDEDPAEWPAISGIHGVFRHLDAETVGGRLRHGEETRPAFDQAKLDRLRARQVEAVRSGSPRSRGAGCAGPASRRSGAARAPWCR